MCDVLWRPCSLVSAGFVVRTSEGRKLLRKAQCIAQGYVRRKFESRGLRLEHRSGLLTLLPTAQTRWFLTPAQSQSRFPLSHLLSREIYSCSDTWTLFTLWVWDQDIQFPIRVLSGANQSPVPPVRRPSAPSTALWLPEPAWAGRSWGMPSLACAAFATTECPLAAWSAFLGTGVSFCIFLTLRGCVPLSLPSALWPRWIYCCRVLGPVGPQPFVTQHLTAALPGLSLSC